ncbi:hypothetical protein [Asanoa siamensis]|uniref:Ribosomally synthesized peptide with SipW-like signal peptide n=1 Tax=Asanoa siamensis TaxID=926357 RepID=A0ABQ4CHF7_9ACTN|nr:hypothetical protein [Asanoa siamensis]GIF70729.1 hypothetical protein Asi02nite_02470 [Asanoa siamensis]
MQKRSKRILAATLAFVGVAAAAGTAWAVFSEQSTASAGGTTADMSALVVGSGVDAPKIDYFGDDDTLWPNVDAGATDYNPETGLHPAQVIVKVTNNNKVPVKVTSADIAGTAVFNNSGVQATCGTYLKVFATPSIPAPVTVAANGGTETLTITGVYLDEAAPNDCQGGAVTTTWTITGKAL